MAEIDWNNRENNDLMNFIVHEARKERNPNGRRLTNNDQIKKSFNRYIGNVHDEEHDLNWFKNQIKNLLVNIVTSTFLAITKGRTLVYWQILLDEAAIGRLEADGVTFTRTAEGFTDAKIAEIQFPAAWDHRESNDLFAYVAEASREAGGTLNMSNVFKAYTRLSGTRRTKKAISAHWYGILKSGIEKKQLPLTTIALMLYATKTLATETFYENLKKNSIFVKTDIILSKFTRRKYAKLEGNEQPITDATDEMKKLENKILDFLLDEVPSQKLDISQFSRNFKNQPDEDERVGHSSRQIAYHFNTMTEYIQQLRGHKFDMNTRARILLASSTPIDRPFYQMLKRYADLNEMILETERAFKTKPEEDKKKTKPKGGLYPDEPVQNVDILQNENTWSEKEDNDLFAYIAYNGTRGREIDYTEYIKYSQSKRSVEQLKDRFAYLKKHIEDCNFLPMMRVRILYATGGTISEGFLNTLQNAFPGFESDFDNGQIRYKNGVDDVILRLEKLSVNEPSTSNAGEVKQEAKKEEPEYDE